MSLIYGPRATLKIPKNQNLNELIIEANTFGVEHA